MNKVIYLVGLGLLCTNAIVLEDHGSRIINGNFATDLPFPYMASLQQIQANNQVTVTRGHRCGGVLITYQHMLTSASCLHNNVNGVQTLINPAQFRVFAGSSLLTNDSSADRVRSIANFTINPEYLAPPAHVNDIAIVTLQTPFPIGTVVPLPIQRNLVDPPQDTVCTVSGWGAATATNLDASTQLRYAKKSIYSQNLCTLIYNLQADKPNIKSSMVCAQSFDLSTAGCTGDIGNPLVCNGNLTGLLFAHTGCVASAHPELYTRVSNHTEWIRSITGNASAITPGLVLLTVLTVLQAMFKNIF